MGLDLAGLGGSGWEATVSKSWAVALAGTGVVCGGRGTERREEEDVERVEDGTEVVPVCGVNVGYCRRMTCSVCGWVQLVQDSAGHGENEW